MDLKKFLEYWKEYKALDRFKVKWVKSGNGSISPNAIGDGLRAIVPSSSPTMEGFMDWLSEKVEERR